MVLSPIGYRAVARALQIIAPLLPGGHVPSANGGQFWVLRLGLYELERRKEQADDWAWMIDHTMHSGNGKCFLVVGVRLSVWNAQRLAALEEDPQASFALKHEDLSVFAIERMDSSTGEVVHQRLEELAEATGITPCCILSDQGADVRRAARLFCQAEGRSTVVRHDIAHAAATRFAEATKLRGALHIRIEKRIPMGGGLGGGSSNAASVLLALPALTGKILPTAEMLKIAASLGSDVPFFLLGGAAIALGRGEELYPAPDFPPLRGCDRA